MSNVFTGNISDLVTEEEYLANKPTIGKELKKGIGRGIDLLQANAYGALAAHADVAKANTVRDWAEKGQQSNMQEAAQNPAAEPSFTGLGKAYTDGGIANGIGRTGLWAAGVVGELAPQGAAAMASGAIGKRLGGGAGSAGLMMANNVAQETGSIYGDILEKTGKMEGATAIEYGIPAALIDTAVEAVPVGKVLGSGLGSGSVIKDVAKAGVKQLVTEAPTEAIQTGIERAAVTSVDPDQQTFTPEGWKEIIDSAAAGGIGGAVSGAGAEGIGRGLQTLTQNRQEQGVAGGQPEEVLPVAPQAFNPSPQIQTDPIARHVDNQVQAAASVDPSGGPLSKAVSTGVETGAVAIEAVKQAASDPAIQAKNLREIQNEIQANQEAKQAIETGQALLDAQEQLPAGDRAEGPDTQVAVSTNESRNVFGLSPADQDHILRREAKKLARVRAAYSDPATLAMAQNAKTETARLSDLENKDAELNKVRAKVDGRLNVPEFQDQLVRMADNAGWEEIGGRVIMRDLEGNGRMTAVGRTPWAPKEEWFVGGLGSKEQIQTAVRKAINGEKLGDKQRQIVEYMLDFAGENIITTAQRNYEYDQFFEKHDINGTGNMTEAEMDEFFNSPEFMQPMSILSGVGMPEEGKVLNPEQEALVEFVQDHAGDPDVADAIAVFASSASQLSGMDGSPETISKAFEAKARGDNERQQQEQPISESAQGESTGGIGRGAEWGQTTQGEGILQSYTSEEIAAKEKAAADAASKAAQDAAKAEQKARADAERGDFQLTGSDRPADVAAAAGQNDLFGAGSRKKTNSPEISSSQQTNPPEEAKPDGEIRQESDEDQQDAPLVTYWADRASDLHDVAVVLRDKISDQPNSDGAVAEISHEMVKFQLMTMDHSKGRRPTPEQFKDIADSLEAVISKYTGGQDIDGLIEKYGSFGTKALPKPVKKNVLAEAKAKKQAEEAAAQPKEDQANDNPIIPPEPKEDAPQTTEEPNLLAARDIMDRYKKIVGNKVAEGKIRKEMLALASKTDLNEHPKTAMALDMLATRLGYDGDMGWKESEVKPQSAPAVATAPEHVDLEENAGVSVKGMDDEAANQALVDAAGDSGSAVISQNTKDRPMREQRLIASGEQLYSATGRKISPAPKIDTSSKLKLAGSIKRMNQWLYDEAMKEAVETGSDWNQTLIKGISVKSLSQSDKDTLNQILFGDADGASDKNRSPGNGQPVDPRGKSILKDISAGKEEADHIPDVRKKVEEDKPAILTLSKAKYIDATAKEQGIKKGSPGYDAAIKRLESAYDEDLNKALAALPFDQFHDWNVKDGSKSEAMNRSAWEALREEHGITEAKTESRERKKPDFDPAVFVKIAADSIDKLRPQDVDRVLADAYALGRDQLGGMTQYIMDYNAKLMPQVVEFFEEVAGFLEDTNDKRIKHFVDVGLRRRNAIDLRESIAKNFGEDLAGLQLQGASDRYAFFLPDASNEGKVRVTYFDKNGLSGHTTYDTYAKALDEAIQDGYRTESQGSLERLSELDSFKAGNEWAHKLQAFHDGKITWADFVAGKDANEKQAEAKDPLGVSEERELSDYIASDYRNASNSTAIAGTGWVMHDDSINSAGTIQLVSASRNVIRDIKYDPKSGTDHRRAIVRATVWAQENPDKFEATKEELVSKPEFDPKIESEESSLDQKETIKDFGEKIGGARKDMEIKSSKKVGKKSSDTRPAWERRFEIVEVAASNRPEEVGRWFIYDTKKKDWMGNPVRVG